MTRYATTVHPTPVGDVMLAYADERLLALEVLHRPLVDAQLALAQRVQALPERDDDVADAARWQLDEYFDGERRTFELELDWSLVRGFTRAALEAVREIPYGETAGYGEVAMLAGSPRASRAVGTACATTPFSIVVPVHRVIRADGSLGEYGGHPEVKRFLLDLESGAGA